MIIQFNLLCVRKCVGMEETWGCRNVTMPILYLGMVVTICVMLNLDGHVEQETLLNLIYAMKFVQMEDIWENYLAMTVICIMEMDVMPSVLWNTGMPVQVEMPIHQILVLRTVGIILILEFCHVMMEILKI